MAVSWTQKLRLALRGWNRRREDERSARDREFLEKNVSWAPAKLPLAKQQTAAPAPGSGVDRDGLQVAFLDDSGRIQHYLDLQTGETAEVLIEEREARPELTDRHKYRPVPTRTEESEALDRRAFLEILDDASLRSKLLAALSSADPPMEFRRVLAGSRAAERAWYNFKNDRAHAAVERWLKDESLGS